MPMLLQTRATAVRRLLDAALLRQGLEIPTPYQFIQAETIVAMAEAGLGVAVQPASRLEKANLKATRIVDLVEPAIMRSMALITLRHQRLSPAAQSLADKIIRDVRAMTNFQETAELNLARSRRGSSPEITLEFPSGVLRESRFGRFDIFIGDDHSDAKTDVSTLASEALGTVAPLRTLLTCRVRSEEL